MKKLFSSAVALGVLLLLSVAAFAQTPNPPATRPPAGQAVPANTAAPAGGTGAEGKVAIVYTGAFRNGILELKAKLDVLNNEFEPKNKQLQAAQEEVNNLKNKINQQGATVQPAVRNQWVDEATQKETQLKRMAEDLDQLAKRRYEEVSGPVYEKIGNTLEQYSKQRGIILVLEGTQLQQTQILVFAISAMDITEDFMKEYNKSNPASAAASGTASAAGATSARKQ